MALEDLHPNRTIASYILGLLWSDGTIGKFGSRRTPTVSFNQSGERGRELIQWIRDTLVLNNKITIRESHREGYNWSTSYNIGFTKYSDILVELGFKSPKRYRDIPADFEPGPFLLGLFDGDGSVYSIEHGSGGNKIQFCGPKLIVQWITIFTRSDYFRTRHGTMPAPPSHSGGGNWIFRCGIREYLSHVYDIMYTYCIDTILYDKIKHSKLLAAANYTSLCYKPKVNLDIDQLVENYKSGQSIRSMGTTFNVCPTTISRWLKRAGVTIRSRNDHRE